MESSSSKLLRANLFQSEVAFLELFTSPPVSHGQSRFASPGGCRYVFKKAVVEMNKFQQPKSNLPGRGLAFFNHRHLKQRAVTPAAKVDWDYYLWLMSLPHRNVVDGSVNWDGAFSSCWFFW